MDNDAKMLLSVGWLIFGNMMLAIILVWLGINPLNYKSPNFIVGFIILMFSIMLSLLSIFYYNEKSNEKARQYREKMYPLKISAYVKTGEIMKQKYPSLKDVIHNITKDEVVSIIKQHEKDTK